jgi:hypothetical protein
MALALAPYRGSDRRLTTLVCVGLAIACSSVHAQPTIDYAIRKGDTLVSIARERFEDPKRWPEIAQINAVRERALKPGSTIQLPKRLLKATPSQARVLAVAGKVDIDGQPLRAEGSVAAGQWMVSERNSSATLQLADQSVITIGPGTRARFEVLRYFGDPDLLEVRLQVEQGRAEASSPPNRPKPFEIRTPAATAAVRGTVFRASADAAGATTEVLSGAVQWSAPLAAVSGPRRASAVAVERDYGAAASPQGEVRPPEALLPAPRLTRSSASEPIIAEQVVAALPVEPVPGAARYRLRVARDAQFTQLIEESLSGFVPQQWTSPQDGQVYFSLRAIAPSRIEGKDVQWVMQMAARPVAPEPARPAAPDSLTGTAIPLEWQPQDQAGGLPVKEYEVRWTSEPDMRNFTSVRTALTRHAVPIPPVSGGAQALPTASLLWQVAAVDTQGKRGPFSSPLRLQWWGAPALGGLQTQNQSIEVSWPAQPGVAYRVLLADNPAFSNPQIRESQSGSLRFDALSPGRYYTQLQAQLPNGAWGPSSAPLQTQILPPPSPPPAVFDSLGTPWSTGSGSGLQRLP